MNNRLTDKAGMSLSFLCLIHCLLFPIIVLLIPAMESWLFYNETLVHWILLGLALPVSALAFGHAVLHHADWMTAVLGALGLAMLILGVTHVFGHASEIYLTVPGAFILFAAHLRNWKHHMPHSHASTDNE